MLLVDYEQMLSKKCNINHALLHNSLFFFFFVNKFKIIAEQLEMNSFNYQVNTRLLAQSVNSKSIVCSNFRPEKLVLRFRRPFMPRT
jgi:hypothetical protein